VVTLYTDFDRDACAWTRELAARGHITPGDVLCRDIAEITDNDLAPYSRVHFFAGIGVWDHALALAGWPDSRPVWTGSCPCQPFSSAGKRKGTDDARHLWPDFLRHIAERRPATVFGEQVASRLGREWLAGVRADLEALGYRVGAADLCAAGVGAPHIRQRLFWVADAGRSGVQLGVRSSESHGAQGAPQDEAREWERGGSDARGCGLVGRVGHAERDGLRVGRRASADQPDQSSNGPLLAGRMGLATSGRDRAPTIAGSDRQGEEARRERVAGGSGSSGPWSEYIVVPCGDGKARRIEPGLSPLVDGAPARVVRLRGYGNAIVAQIAATFIAAFLDATDGPNGHKDGPRPPAVLTAAEGVVSH
jgi:DNA (cytosine-5)-methyltransferase 1